MPTQLRGPLMLATALNGHLLVANSDGYNVDPNQPSEIVEFTPCRRRAIGSLDRRQRQPAQDVDGSDQLRHAAKTGGICGNLTTRWTKIIDGTW